MSNNKVYRNDNIAVAAIDLLGFSEQVRNDIENALKSIEIIRECTRKFSFGTVQKYNHFSGTLVSSPDITPAKEFFWDSIYIYGNLDAPIRKQIRVLLFLTCYIILTGIVKKQYFARAGIATGNILIKESSENKICIGSSIVNAHELEKNQNWIGGAIVFDDYKPPYLEPGNQASYIAKYKPPLKKRINNNSKIFALNWLNSTLLQTIERKSYSVSEVKKYIEKLKNEETKPQIKIKYENTFEFIQKNYKE